MLKQLKRFTLQVIAGANIATILVMLFVGYSDHVSPETFPTLSTAGLAFPAILVVNLAFLLFWLIFKPLYALIPIGGLLLGFQPVRNYCPLNLLSPSHAEAGKDSVITLLSFNAYNLEQLSVSDFQRHVVDYLLEQDADIVCMQEFQMTVATRETLSNHYPYIDTTRVVRGGDALTVMSRFPILGKQHIYSYSPDNQRAEAHSAAFLLQLDTDTLVVVNSHLESTRLSEQERANFKRIVKGDMERNDAGRESKKLLERLAESTRLRAPQVTALCQHIDSVQRSPKDDKSTPHQKATNGQAGLLLCGDFNDGPISYAHHAVAERLTDCYVKSGNGPGISYHANAFYVRIDHIFCSSQWQPVYTKIDKNMAFSDHYPLICTLKRPLKP